MQQLGLVAAVIFATAILIPVSTRINLPWPVLVTVFGLLLAAIPQVPQVHVEPELILPLVLPPLLFAAARKTSWRLWIANARPILLLAVALVVVTTAVVAAVASAVVPGISLAGTVALGALVSPPDPVAATAIASKLHLPKRLVSMLEGEGLFNDVAALVLYQVAIAAVVGGSFSPGEAALKLLLAAVLALVVGFAFGWGVSRLIALLGTGDPRPQVLLSILAPTATYVAAEEVHGSGVLAVLVYTLYSVSRPVDAADAQGRLTTDVFWSMTETLVTGIAFGLVGLEF
jgi:NhaP-type Na+/H+ or K+/H+ antiporter